jgi:hypothetical protein
MGFQFRNEAHVFFICTAAINCRCETSIFSSDVIFSATTPNASPFYGVKYIVWSDVADPGGKESLPDGHPENSHRILIHFRFDPHVRLLSS